MVTDRGGRTNRPPAIKEKVMAKKQSNGEIGDTVELADKETGFYDPETKLQISRDQTAKLEEKIGKKTHKAILAGRLLIVDGKSKKQAKVEPETDEFDIPQDLPGREAFVAAGLTTFESIKALDTEEKLLEVKGIGKGTVKALTAWAKNNAPEE